MNNQKVLVTGSSGFMGSHIADILSENGYQVKLFDIVPSKFKKDEQDEYIGDILKIEDVQEAMKGCSIVYHFAAQADIDLSSDQPSQTINTNIKGTQNILESMLKLGLKRLIFSSTIYVYSKLGSFYRVSKQACEKIIEEYKNQFDIDYTILRFGSLYGPRANEFNGILKFLNQALKENKITRVGDGEEIREYIHVKDAAVLSYEALNDEFLNKHLIITGNQQIRVKDLLLMIKEIFCGEIEIEFKKNIIEPHHYEITPYNYKPKIAKKITPKVYYDLGQGIIDQIYDLQQAVTKPEINKKK
tara:strand:+ start:286 stop:1191 length:906 start_codon:yes stop_codon:yes gene_type:complete